jgi:hypothetical protein
MRLPDLKNSQAKTALLEAYLQLKKSATLQHRRAELINNALLTRHADDDLGEQLKDLDKQRDETLTPCAVQIATAYESYGYTPDAIDPHTFRLKPGAKPERDKATAKN